MNKSDTPITDAAAEEVHFLPTEKNPGSGFGYAVDADFARNFERENSRLLKIISDFETLPRIKRAVVFSRTWAMPNGNTFEVPPIGDFVRRYIAECRKAGGLVIDPFARNNTWADCTNDLNPKTTAQNHMKAEDWLPTLVNGQRFALAILDMPYSPRQISECYKEAGLTAGMAETQNAKLYGTVKSLLVPLLTDDAIVLSFGWNTCGMGKKHGFE